MERTKKSVGRNVENLPKQEFNENGKTRIPRAQAVQRLGPNMQNIAYRRFR